MTAAYDEITKKVEAVNDGQYLDFHARRLVEMAGNIIMAYLLVLNSQSDSKFNKSAKLFVNLIKAENKERYDYINNFELEDLELYRVTEVEVLKATKELQI
jgi:hypothetical protein